MKRLYLSAAALLTVALAGAQTVTGRWTGNFSTADNGLEIVVALNQAADGAINGYILSPRSTDTITTGKIEGSNLTLEAERSGRGGVVQKVTYTATVDGGKMKLTVPAPNFGGQGRGRGGPGAGGPPPGAGPGGPPPAGRGPGGPGGGRGGQPQVVDLARVSTDVPAALPPRPEPVSLPMPTTPVKYNSMSKTPPMGWNSWNKFRNQVSDKMVREMADAIVRTGMRDAGYIYVNIDDTWEAAARDAAGNITTNNKFPDIKPCRLHPQ
jgi:alpha-galactosidase